MGLSQNCLSGVVPSCTVGIGTPCWDSFATVLIHIDDAFNRIIDMNQGLIKSEISFLLMTNSNCELLTGLPPILNPSIHTLLLGSFPGAASLAAQQYYAHPQNQFWRLLSALLNEKFTELDYPSRLEKILAHGIGVWDVIASCQREGSLDSAIRHAQANQFTFLHEHCRLLKRVCFNGKTSGKFAPLFAQAGFETIVLPSSSPANARASFEQKLLAWRAVLQ